VKSEKFNLRQKQPEKTKPLADLFNRFSIL